MAKIALTALQTKIDTLLADNENGDISEADVRDVLTDMKDTLCIVAKGNWNANTNSPALASGVGNDFDYYRCDTAGSTTIDGISNWGVEDWIIFIGGAWRKIKNSSEYVAPIQRWGTTIKFDREAVYGSVDAPEFEDITMDVTDFQNYVPVTIIHNSNWYFGGGVTPSFFPGVQVVEGTYDADSGMYNIIKIVPVNPGNYHAFIYNVW